MMRGWYCSETGWGCGSSFQAMEEDEVIRQATDHVRNEHGETADDDSLLGKIKSYLRDVSEGDETNMRTSTGNLGADSEHVTGGRATGT
jgi:predicted small metal-binding protein